MNSVGHANIYANVDAERKAMEKRKDRRFRRRIRILEQRINSLMQVVEEYRRVSTPTLNDYVRGQRSANSLYTKT